MELKPRGRRGAAKVKVSGVRLEALRAELVAAGGDVLLSPSRAANYCRRAQVAPSVTRQLVDLWARRHGAEGEAYVYDERFQPMRLLVSLAWLVRFLERTGRGLEAPAHG